MAVLPAGGGSPADFLPLPGGGPNNPYITDPISPNIQGLIAQILQAAQRMHGPAIPAPQIAGALQGAYHGQASPMGAPGVVTPPAGHGFSFYGQSWGPNDFSAFAKALAAHGISVNQFARAHPTAFSTFNVDPRIKQLIGATFAPAAGGMGHA